MKTLEKIPLLTSATQTISSTTGAFIAVSINQLGNPELWSVEDSTRAHVDVDIFCVREGEVLPKGADIKIGGVVVEGVFLAFFIPSLKDPPYELISIGS